MKKHITDEKNGLDYTLVNGVYLPNFVSTETNYEIGMWGQRHLDYLMNHHKSFYTSLKTSCKLNSYLHEVDVRATEMYDRLVKQLKEQQGWRLTRRFNAVFVKKGWAKPCLVRILNAYNNRIPNLLNKHKNKNTLKNKLTFCKLKLIFCFNYKIIKLKI